MHQEAGAGSAALDRPRRKRRLVEILAAAAGPARAGDALHHEVVRDVLQLLCDILAETLDGAAAVRAALARRENCLPARQMIRQGTTLWLRPGTGRCLGRPGDLLMLQPGLEPVECHRGSAEALPAQAGKLMPEFLDQKIAVAQLGVPRHHHHRLQCSEVVGQGAGLFEHDEPYPKGL